MSNRVVDEVQPSSRKSAKQAMSVRHGKLKPRNAWSLPLKVILTMVVVGFLSVTSVVAYAAWDLASSVKAGVSLGNEDSIAGLSIGAIPGGVNLLIAGSDARSTAADTTAYGDAGGARNDVTMLLHISQDHTRATIVSFPRDMYVSVPECTDSSGNTVSAQSYVKINTTLGTGLGCVVKTVEQLVGINIPFAAEIGFDGLAAMSNAVGGVTVCVASQIQDTYTGTFLDPGEHTLQGVAALQFLRTRHGIGDGSDLTRISNQQVFLTALARKLTAEGTLSNPATLYALAKGALANMTLSDSLHDIGRLISIASALKSIPLANITFVQYPNVYVQGGGGVAPEPVGAAALNTALQNDQAITLSGGTGGSILDTTQTDAQKAADAAASATASAAATDAASATSASATALPTTVTGTTADTVTCSKGRTLANQ